MSATSTMTAVVPHRRVMSLQAPPRESSLRAEPKFGQYVLGQTLGEGEFGKVKLGWPCKRNGTKDDAQVAIKLIRRETIGHSPSRMNKIEREISVLRKVNHPNIVKCLEVVQTDKYIGIILEYASGGELFDFILAHRYLKDPVASKLFAQLISAVQYLHKMGIVHRDLKLENLLLDRNRNIVVTDFGFANTFNPKHSMDDSSDFVKRDILAENSMTGDMMQTSCGSPCYAAPELVVSDGWYCGQKVDVWSCGVILYALLSGYLPFDDDPLNPEGDDIGLLYQYIVSTALTFPEYVSPLARDLLRRILVPDPKKRVGLRDIVIHPWLAAHSRILVEPILRSDARTIASSDSKVGSMTGQDMIRSSSERTAAHTSFALPANNHLIPTGFAKNTSMCPSTKTPIDNTKKRHTVQIEYDVPSTSTVRELDTSAAPKLDKVIESEVMTLSIPAAPIMARSVTHTGTNQEAAIPNSASFEIGVNGRNATKLPAPQKKPRPTSYHPAYRRPEDELAPERRIPSDPSESHSLRLDSRGSGRSRSRGGIQIPKTASPKSTKQNASGELYAVNSINNASQDGVLMESDSRRTNITPSSATRPSHKRNSSSISSMLGKLWPLGNSQDLIASRRMSTISPSAPLNSIVEANDVLHSARFNDPTQTDAKKQAMLSGTSKGTISGSEVGNSSMSEVAMPDATNDSTSELKKAPQIAGLVNAKQTGRLYETNQYRTSTSAARRVMEFFTNRRKDRT